MTRQINLYDYFPATERLTAVLDDYKPKKRSEDPRWTTAKAILSTLPIVTEDPDGYSAITQAVDRYLKLDLKTAYQMMVGNDVKWTESQKIKGEHFRIDVIRSGRAIALVPSGSDAVKLLPESLQLMRPMLRKESANFPVKSKKDRYLIVSAGPEGTTYYTINADTINKANAEKLAPAYQAPMVEVAS